MSSTEVGPGGYSDNPRSAGWNRIMAATVTVIAILVAVFLVYAVTVTSTGGSIIPRSFFPSGIDRERTLPVDQAPPQPGIQLPSGDMRGSVGPNGGTGGTVGGTGTGGPGGLGGPTGPATGAPGIGGR